MGEQSGIPRGKRTPRIQALLDRALAGGPDCIPWPGRVDANGYAHLSLSHGVRTKAHRAVWIIAHGPTRLSIDHACHDPETCPGGPTCPHRRCMNLDHLRPATAAEQWQNSTTRLHPERMGEIGALGAAGRPFVTHCPAGHPYDEANTYTHSGSRQCRTCRRLKKRK